MAMDTAIYQKDLLCGGIRSIYRTIKGGLLKFFVAF